MITDTCPNFSLYRIPYETDSTGDEQELFLHILYMKSSEKSLSRNYNA
jgi:hypothetical protein